jgi:hypothetical protein
MDWKRLRLPQLEPTTWFYVAVAVVASAPAWIVKYPPMQDLPFHLATIRVIHDFHNSDFGFDQNYILTLGRTQYAVYYLIGSALAYVLGVVKANVVLMSVYLGGTVLALRDLLRALGKDERLCLFVVPLLANVMFMFGLLPFLLGIPIMFWALATAARHFEKPTIERGVLLCILTLALFYSHIFPFGIFGLGFAAMFPWGKPGRWLKAAAPALPALLVLTWWTFFTEAGRLSRGAMTDNTHDPRMPIDQAINDAHSWFTNIFSDTSSDTILIALLVVALLATGLAQGERDRAKPFARAYVLLPIACVFFYFTSPLQHNYIWLIAQRFPILFAMTGIPLLRMPSGARGWMATAAALAVAGASIVTTCKHFVQFQLEEVGDIDGAIEAMAPNKKVCALIYDRGSRITNNRFVPFMHFGSYYQVHKGGVVMFTYAGYAHWPIDFKPGKYPPPGGPARQRWEWTPESVPVQGEIYPYYDYVLTRGAGFHPPPGTYRKKWSGDRWTVWEREG